jgi:ankyrin repeat protein
MLMTALKCEVPNMDVVRLLVEKFDVDVNEFRYAREHFSNTRYDMTQQGTALHELASGKHWWHAILAIPYLISKGADVNAKSKDGRTPLHVALGGPNNHISPFHKDAARALVIAGANVNLRDEKGISCLACTAGDPEMVQLLLHHKADVTADALFMAIYARRIDVLKTLLKTGVNPDMRLETMSSPPSEKARSKKPRPSKDAPSSEEYPLYYAAIHHGASDHSRSSKDMQTEWSETEEMMRTLLSAGANPYATFCRWAPTGIATDNDEEREDPSICDLLRDGRVSQIALVEAVLVHELLDQNDMVHPILELETLDASRRDTLGRTLLHMA